MTSSHGGPKHILKVARDTIEHCLVIKREAKSNKQKLCCMSVDRREATKFEVAKLLKAGIICEVKHLEWLANPVLVRKATDKWHMHVDFTDLNKASPKDDFSLPRIEQLLDATQL